MFGGIAKITIICTWVASELKSAMSKTHILSPQIEAAGQVRSCGAFLHSLAGLRGVSCSPFAEVAAEPRAGVVHVKRGRVGS